MGNDKSFITQRKRLMLYMFIALKFAIPVWTFLFLAVAGIEIGWYEFRYTYFIIVPGTVILGFIEAVFGRLYIHDMNIYYIWVFNIIFYYLIVLFFVYKSKKIKVKVENKYPFN